MLNYISIDYGRLLKQLKSHSDVRMPLSAKVFRVKEYIPLDIIADKIRLYKTSREEDELKLDSFFEDIHLIGDTLKAFFVYDEAEAVNIKGELRKIARRREALIAFKDVGGELYLIVFEKKYRANKIANLISEILFTRIGGIIEVEIPHETLKTLHESNPEATKVIYFDNVDIPNINKLALYGSDLADSNLYNMYLEHGKIWYVVFQHKESGYVVGITRNLIIAMFSNITLDDFLNFIIEHILPMIHYVT